MEKIDVIAAPGPVCYPLIAAKDGRFNVEFKREGKAEIILDSSVSMVKRGLPITLSLIRNLSVAYPGIGRKIGIMRRGSSNEILVKAILEIQGKSAEIVTISDFKDLSEMMRTGFIDSAIVPAPFAEGQPLEKLLADNGVRTPGSCVAYVRDDLIEDFSKTYASGIREFIREPEEASRYVSSVLPNSTDPDFIMKSILNTDAGVMYPPEHSMFIELIRRQIL